MKRSVLALSLSGLLAFAGCATAVDDGGTGIVGGDGGGLSGKTDGGKGSDTKSGEEDSSVVDTGAPGTPDTGTTATDTGSATDDTGSDFDTEFPAFDADPGDTGDPSADTGPTGGGTCANCSAGVCSSSTSDETCFLTCFYSYLCFDCIYDEPTKKCTCTGC